MKNLLLLSFFFSLQFVFGQGCSDAGFCTIDNLQVHPTDSLASFKNSIKVGFNIGSADNDVSVFGSYLEYSRKINNNFSLDAKLNYVSQSGKIISSAALSDLFLVSNFRIDKKTAITAGLKIPLTNGNLKENGMVLPMDFQPSLGTLDLILGISRRIEKFSFVLAYQQPLTQNENQFFAPIGSNFFSTNNYKRAADLLFRATYLYNFNNKFSVSPSVLPIYHLQNDTFTDVTNTEREISGSQGLTLNANVYFNYNLNASSAVEFSFGSPFIVRDARPDGLTRGFVANVEYKITF